MQTKFKKSDWQKLAIFSEPTETAPQIRRGTDGGLYAWTHGGKYVHATRIVSPLVIVGAGWNRVDLTPRGTFDAYFGGGFIGNFPTLPAAVAAWAH